jgi:hypothetical protein
MTSDFRGAVEPDKAARWKSGRAARLTVARGLAAMRLVKRSAVRAEAAIFLAGMCISKVKDKKQSSKRQDIY